jgi:uncharacterized protein (DUF433 family)
MPKPLITQDPKVMVGKPVIAGTRITVELISERIASGATVEQILDSYPHLTEEGVRAALAYAAEHKRELASSVAVDKSVCGGRPVIRGTRMPVELLLGRMSGGMTVEDVCKAYRLEPSDVLAALHYASEVIGGRRQVDISWDPDAEDRWLSDDDAFEEIPLDNLEAKARGGRRDET